MAGHLIFLVVCGYEKVYCFLRKVSSSLLLSRTDVTLHRDQAISIDLMPLDDDTQEYHQRNSLFQDRRRAQMSFLQKVWPEFWPEYPMLTAKEARRIMKAGLDDVEEILEYVAHCAAYQHRGRNTVTGTNEDGKEIITREKIDHPIGYVIKAIKNDLKRDSAALQEQISPTVRIQEVKPTRVAKVMPDIRPRMAVLGAPRSNERTSEADDDFEF